MPTHTEVEERLVVFLKTKGFSEKAILYDPEYESPEGAFRARPDIVIAEPETRDPLAIIEVKAELRPDKKPGILGQVGSYASLFTNSPTYLVTDGEGPARLSFYRYNRETKDLESIPLEMFPSLPALLAERVTAKQAAIGAVRVEREQTSRKFYFLCFGLAFGALGLAVADFILKQYHGVELMTPTRLALFGAAVGLALVPFVQKFKGLGFEYERLIIEKRDST